MEASVDAPKKASRPAYKPLWEDMGRKRDALDVQLREVSRDRDKIAAALSNAKTEAQYYFRNFVGMGIVAILEVITLFAILAR